MPAAPDLKTATRAQLEAWLTGATHPEILAEKRRMDEAGDIPGGLAGGFYLGLSNAIKKEDIRAMAESGSTEAGTGFGSGGGRRTPARTESHNRAMRVLDSLTRSGDLPAYGAERVESLLNTGLPTSRNLVARWALAAGDEHYATAFARLAADPERGHLMWTPEESEAYRRAVNVQSEMRAMSTTGNAGGYLIPLTLDPAVILTNDGSNNPMRRISRVVQTVTNEWRGVTSAGVSAQWIAEATEVADVTPTIAQPPIPVYKGDAFTQYSFEVGMDAVDLLGQLKMVLADAADQLQATAFTTGPGSTAPTGIVTALAGTASEINTTGSEAMVSSDAYALQNALGPRWQPNAQWIMGLPTMNTFRQYETTAGALKFPELTGNPPYLLGRPVHENSNMDSTLNVAATQSNYVAVYGDFRNFVIVDRIGSTLELIPNMFGSNRLPTGQRGALLWFRTGSDSVNDGAFRMLDIPTTA
ncbi:phage major capsid protein [Streptomyces fulvoviolaceus]|uniref:phage major capsid protein n=1 Tax=Streptomyces fulvoviolaceus TaxID=285535 RepID=UPI0006932885|nr:phage major capsid protein [Streptomyces fulvoviolaceus]